MAKVIWQRPHRMHLPFLGDGDPRLVQWFMFPGSKRVSTPRKPWSVQPWLHSEAARRCVTDRLTDRRPGSSIAVVRIAYTDTQTDKHRRNQYLFCQPNYGVRVKCVGARIAQHQWDSAIMSGQSIVRRRASFNHARNKHARKRRTKMYIRPPAATDAMRHICQARQLCWE